jgi:hypothetical protein
MSYAGYHREEARFSALSQEAPSAYPGERQSGSEQQQPYDPAWNKRTSPSGRVQDLDVPYDFTYSSDYGSSDQPKSPVYTPRQDVPPTRSPNYKPSALRWPFLTLLLLALVAAIGLLGYCIHVLPAQTSYLTQVSLNMKKAIEIRSTAVSTTTAAVSTTATSISTTPKPISTPTTTHTPSISSSKTSREVHSSPANDQYGQAGKIITLTTSIEIHSSLANDQFGQAGKTITPSTSTMTTVIVTTNEDGFGQADKTVTVTTPAPVTSTTEENGFSQAGKSVTVTKSDTTIAVSASKDVYGKAGETIIITSIPLTGSTLTFTPTVTQAPITLTNSQGSPTLTYTATPSISTTKLTNSQGKTTATYLVVVPAATPPSAISNTAAETTPYLFISWGDYFVGFFLPTVLATILAIPIRILDVNAKLFQPWHALTRSHGAEGRDSLCLQTGGAKAVIVGARLLFGGQPLVFLGTLLTLCSALMVPLASQAVGLQPVGDCGNGSGLQCTYQLSVFTQPAWATMALLCFMVGLVLAIAIILARWRTGLATNPWSIAGTAGLAGNNETRGLILAASSGPLPEDSTKKILKGQSFELGWFYNDKGVAEYGIILSEKQPDAHPFHSAHDSYDHLQTTKQELPFMLDYISRSIFLLLLCGILIIVAYYSHTGYDTAFERFMDSESFGVKFLFSAIGVLITFLWSSLFGSMYTNPFILHEAPEANMYGNRCRHDVTLHPHFCTTTACQAFHTIVSPHQLFQWLDIRHPKAASFPRFCSLGSVALRVSHRFSHKYHVSRDADGTGFHDLQLGCNMHPGCHDSRGGR